MRTTLLALALFLTSLRARADGAHGQGIVLDGWVGGGATSVVKEEGATGTVGLGLTGLYCYRWFEVGFGYTLQTGFLTLTSTVLGTLVGVKTDPDPWFRLDLLAESGAYLVSGVGNGGFLGPSVVSGGQATSPYLGGRVGASFLLGRAHRFVLGWWVNAGDAVGHTTVQSGVQSCLLGCSTEQESATFGGGSWSTGLRIGGEIAQW
jgi:hypothetical protein